MKGIFRKVNSIQERNFSFMRVLSGVFVFIALTLTSCTKNLDDFGPQNDGETIEVPTTERIIVVNEGNFMFGNGSISVVNIETEEVAQEVFKAQNGFSLGDVPQSLIIHDSLAYVVVNNSGKIEVVKSDNFSSVKTITGFTSPRQMAIVDELNLTGWVTDLYANKIWKVDLSSGQIIGNIPSNGWSENILKWNDKVLVLNKKDSVINVFDIGTEQVIHTIGSGIKIVDFKLWNATELMVLAKTGIYKVNLNTMLLENLELFNRVRTPYKMAVDTIADVVYFLDKDVFKYTSSVQKVITAQDGTSFYGIEVNSSTSELFITDAKDYVQPGEVFKYSFDFQDSVVYSVGVNPQFVVVE